MGDVYIAFDERLDREVAIKILPKRLASDPEAVTRFRSEAKTLAALSHPNIITIHDVGSYDGLGDGAVKRIHASGSTFIRTFPCGESIGDFNCDSGWIGGGACSSDQP